MPLTPPMMLDKKVDPTDPLAKQAFEAGFNLLDICALHLSPIAFGCGEDWKPLLERIEKIHGYVWEWVPAPEDAEHPAWRAQWGMVVLTYIG